MRQRLIQFLSVVIVVNSFPSSISTDPFNVAVTITGAASGTNYLRAELYKDGTENYFGETFNNTDWYSGTTGTQYFSVPISGASTSATFQVRMGTFSQTQYSGSGSYKLKIKRYTSSGN